MFRFFFFSKYLFSDHTMALCFESVTSLSRCLRFTTSLPRLQVSHARSIQSEPAELPLSPPSTSESMYNFVVVGGGSGGLALASNLSRKYGKGQVAVVEPSDVRRDGFLLFLKVYFLL